MLSPLSMTISPTDILNIVIGSLQLMLAVLVMRHLGRFGRSFPWLAALMLYFGLRGIVRLYAGVFHDDVPAFEIATDVVLVVVLVLLAFGIERTVRGLRTAVDYAQQRREEYARALSDYRTLARHRLANPLSAIRGGIATLKDMPDLDADTRAEILEMIDREADRLERVALEPDVLSPEERSLRPRPTEPEPEATIE
jgi:signal transduction histidine kinase